MELLKRRTGKHKLYILITFTTVIVLTLLYHFNIVYRIRILFRDNKFVYTNNTLCNSNIDINTQSKNVISFSLFGANGWNIYGDRVKELIRQASVSELYKDWSVRVYHDTIPDEITHTLQASSKNTYFCNVKLLTIDLKHYDKKWTNLDSINGMVWRFIPIADTSVDIMCSRDLDSDISSDREYYAVKEWIGSNKLLHSMRDRRPHNVYILGGLWCYRNSKNRADGQYILNEILYHSQLRNYKNNEARKGNDQNLLSYYAWPLVAYDSLQHDSYLCNSYPGSSPFPTQRNKNNYFVGCPGSCVGGSAEECPVECRPEEHKDWLYC